MEHIVNWTSIIESLLFAAGDEGLTAKQVATVLDVTEMEAVSFVHDLMDELQQNQNRGIAVVELAGTFQLVTKKENSDYLKKLAQSPHTTTLSQAALETLAIIAYKQPITRVEIEEIRGVKSERPLQTLVGKVLVKEIGRAEGTGRAILYGTTKEFLDYFGLRSLEELPPLPERTEEDFEQEEADLFFENLQSNLGN